MCACVPYAAPPPSPHINTLNRDFFNQYFPGNKRERFCGNEGVVVEVGVEIKELVVLSTCGYCLRKNGWRLANVPRVLNADCGYLLHEPCCCAPNSPFSGTDMPSVFGPEGKNI